MTKRRFVICYDGTWNAPDKGANPTNVVKMVRAVPCQDGDGVDQVVFYDKGVGTAGGTDAITGGGFGKGLTANVVDGYRFLANNYEPGDEIYIFGFSRGAYTARSLAGLMGLANLVVPGDLGGRLLRIVEVYQRPDLDRAQKAEQMRAIASQEPRAARIRCVGVWDTVGSLGIPGDLGRTFLGGKYYFHDVSLGEHIDVALHAVAIDEKRSAFSPTLWVSESGQPASPEQIVEQVWFPGVHSNIGGSYADAGLSDATFAWMAQRVGAHTDLALDQNVVGAVGPANAAAKGIDSRTMLYQDSVFYPYQRIINHEIPGTGGFGGWFRRTFSAFDRRNIPPRDLKAVNEALHVSALERWNLPAVPHDCKSDKPCVEVPYRPVNLDAVIHARTEARGIPVVGWDGLRMAPDDQPWPD